MNRLAHEIDEDTIPDGEEGGEQTDIETHALPKNKKPRTAGVGDNSKNFNAEVLKQHVSVIETIQAEMRALKKKEKEAVAKAKGDGFSVRAIRKVIKDRAADEPGLIAQHNAEVRGYHQLLDSPKVLWDSDQAAFDLGSVGPQAKEERNEYKPMEQNPTSPSLAGKKLKKGQTGKVSSELKKKKVR